MVKRQTKVAVWSDRTFRSEFPGEPASWRVGSGAAPGTRAGQSTASSGKSEIRNPIQGKSIHRPCGRMMTGAEEGSAMEGTAAVLEVVKPIAKAKKGRAGAVGGRKKFSNPPDRTA